MAIKRHVAMMMTGFVLLLLGSMSVLGQEDRAPARPPFLATWRVAEASDGKALHAEPRAARVSGSVSFSAADEVCALQAADDGVGVNRRQALSLKMSRLSGRACALPLKRTKNTAILVLSLQGRDVELEKLGIATVRILAA